MSCEKYRDLVFEYIDKSLEQMLMKEIEEHLKNCDACSKFYREEESLYDDSLTEMIEQVDQIELNEDIKTKIKTKFHEGETETDSE